MGKCNRACDRFCMRCKWCRVFDCRRRSRLLLWIAFFLTLILMIVDLITGITIIFYFYIMTNAAILFRLFNVNWITYILHFGGFLAVIIIILLAYTQFEFWLFMLFLLPILLLFLCSLHFVMFRPGRTVVQRARRAGAHASCGLVVIIFYFLLICFLMGWTILPICLEMIYFLLFLFILLTPHFQTSNQAVRAARERTACKRTARSRRSRRTSDTRSRSRGSRTSQDSRGSGGSRGSQGSRGSRCSNTRAQR